MEPSGLYDYTGNQEYMDCGRDILEHPVFQSMDQYIPVSYTHLDVYKRHVL